MPLREWIFLLVEDDSGEKHLLYLADDENGLHIKEHLEIKTFFPDHEKVVVFVVGGRR